MASGPGDDEGTFENRDGERVTWDNLSDAEQHWHEDKDTSLDIHEYTENWGRGGAVEDDEALDKDSD